MSKLEKRLAFQLTDHHKGLQNQIGENNCFLNVTIQALWHLGPFRTHLQQLIAILENQKAVGLKNHSISLNDYPVPPSKQSKDSVNRTKDDRSKMDIDSAIFCGNGDDKREDLSYTTEEKCVLRNSEESLKEKDQCTTDKETNSYSVAVAPSLLTSLCNLFIQYEFTDQSVLPPNELRESLAKLSSDYELGKIADAVETLDVILQRIHTEFQEICPSSMKCLAHITFGGMILEQTICHLCGGSSEPTVRNSFLLYFQAAEILHEIETIKPSIKLVSLTSQSQPFLTLSMLKNAAKAGFLKSNGSYHYEKIMKKELLKSKQFSAILKRCMMSLGKKSCPSIEEEQRREQEAEQRNPGAETTRSEAVSTSRNETAALNTGNYYPTRTTEERDQLSLSQHQHQQVKCDGEASVFFFSLDPPLILSISIGWKDNWESHDNLHKLYSLISSVVSINDIFSDDINSQNRQLPPQWRNIPGNSSQKPIHIDEKSLSSTGGAVDLQGPCYVFRGMVCYYGLHYVSIFVDSSMNNNSSRNNNSSTSRRTGKHETDEDRFNVTGATDHNSTAEGETYLLFDDSRVRPVGGWKDVVSYCVASCYQPVLLLYELEKHSLKYTTERNQQDYSNLNFLGEGGDGKDESLTNEQQIQEKEENLSNPLIRASDLRDEDDMGFVVVNRDVNEEVEERMKKRIPDLVFDDRQKQIVPPIVNPFLDMPGSDNSTASSSGRFWQRVQEVKGTGRKERQFNNFNEQGSFIPPPSILPSPFDGTAAQPKNLMNDFPDINRLSLAKDIAFQQESTLSNETLVSSSPSSYHSCLSSKSLSSRNQLAGNHSPQQLQQHLQGSLTDVPDSTKKLSSTYYDHSVITTWGRRPYRYRISLPVIRVHLDSGGSKDCSDEADAKRGIEMQAAGGGGQHAHQLANTRVILGIILDLNERNEVLVTDFYRHPHTKEPLAAEISGNIQLLDQLISVNGQSLSHLAGIEQEVLLSAADKDSNSKDGFAGSSSSSSKVPNKLLLIHKLINSLSEPFILLEFQSSSFSVMWYKCPSCSFVNDVLPEKEEQLKKQLRNRLSNRKISANDYSNFHSIQSYEVFFKCKFCSTRNLCDSYLLDLSNV
jgi:hypothetical protein